MKLALTGARIFDGFEIHNNRALLIEDRKVVGIVPSADIPVGYVVEKTDGEILTPGFIDLQINGAGGVLFNNTPTVETLKTMSNAMLTYGVTRILPTLVTDTPTVTLQAIDSVIEAAERNVSILGVHVEGPFFSVEKRGVHQAEKIRCIEKEDWLWLNKLASIPSILTLAPEQVSVNDIDKINGLGVRICAGHTNAQYEQIVAAHEFGVSGFTHLFNAMRPMNGREPGVVGAALTLKDTWAGLIADGIHVHDVSMKLAMEAKGFNKIFLVSDSMATAASSDTSFELYGERIEEVDGRLVNAEGALAGSAITLLDAVRYCITKLELPAEQVLAMASRVPAEYMQLEHMLGSFQTGCFADICLMDDSFNLKRVWQAGTEILL